MCGRTTAFVALWTGAWAVPGFVLVKAAALNILFRGFFWTFMGQCLGVGWLSGRVMNTNDSFPKSLKTHFMEQQPQITYLSFPHILS